MRLGDGRVGVAAKTWAVDPNTPAHVYVGERFDLELAETFIRSLAKRYDVVDIAYDPRFFERSADLLRQGGLCVAPVHQSSAQMTDVYQAFYQAVREGAVAHDGDPVLTAHVEGTAATLTDRGWKISKLHKKKRIDFVPAGAMAVWRALLGDASPLALIDPWGDA
jgi:phage terminase large subunit-like protein